MNSKNLKSHIHNFWDSEIVPTLVDYIKIPNKSPCLDVSGEDRPLRARINKTPEIK